MEELLLWLSLLDNAPNYLVGCITQKRWKNFHCGFLALRTCAFILKSVPKLLECRPTQTLGSRQDFLPSKFIHLCSFLQGHHQDKFDNNRTENIITFSYTIKYFIYKNLRILNNVYCIWQKNICRKLLYWVGFIEIQYQIYTQETSFIHDSCLDFLVSTGS